MEQSNQTLTSLNEKGRVVLADLRQDLEYLEEYANNSYDQKYMAELETQKQQLAR